MALLHQSNSIQLAPEPNTVFKRPKLLSPYLLPIASFELSEVFEDLSGKLHFIDSVEPYEGYMAEDTQDFHTYYCRENWISFKVKNGLYEFEAEEGYFSIHRWKTHFHPCAKDKTIHDYWMGEANTYFAKRAKEYTLWQNKKRVLSSDQIDHRMQLGGKPRDANWVCCDFPISYDEESEPGETFYYPLTEDGRRFRYVGWAHAFDWRCEIHLFFDPKEQRALQTFDWT